MMVFNNSGDAELEDIMGDAIEASGR